MSRESRLGGYMSDIVQFKKIPLKKKHKGKTLCKSGFHKWQIVKTSPFQVKLGKLLTQYSCTRCGATKTEKR
ncbi:hypothetical protein MNBD_GAMMA22-1487 [hydrothermal vent metagenome]|uniref:Uncharacterized protein n=1 Tax=hydrothermal vent metagenome TaxID=652676 RepID=A0A3B1ALW0_9ZZZZ